MIADDTFIPISSLEDIDRIKNRPLPLNLNRENDQIGFLTRTRHPLRNGSQLFQYLIVREQVKTPYAQ